MIMLKKLIYYPDDWTTATCLLCRETIEICKCPMCEYCDIKIQPDLTWISEDLKKRFCCQECHDEYMDDMRIADMEDAWEYDWGNDYNSWT